jgi:hypothetical protein
VRREAWITIVEVLIDTSGLINTFSLWSPETSDADFRMLNFRRLGQGGSIRQGQDPWCEGRSWIYLIAGGDGVTFTDRLSGHVLRCHIKQYKVRIRVPSIPSLEEASIAWISHVASATIIRPVDCSQIQDVPKYIVDIHELS